MKSRTNKKETTKKVVSRTCFIASGILFLSGSIGMTNHFTKASAGEYSLAGSSVILNGTDDGSATVTLGTSVARLYTAIGSVWSTHEVVETGETQTTNLTLSGMTRGDNILADFGANGATAWFANPGEDGMPVAANGAVLTATYTVDKDTPEGTYKITFSDGIFNYNVDGNDVEESDTITGDATITVTRDETSGESNGEGNESGNEGNESGNESGNEGSGDNSGNEGNNESNNDNGNTSGSEGNDNESNNEGGNESGNESGNDNNSEGGDNTNESGNDSEEGNDNEDDDKLPSGAGTTKSDDDSDGEPLKVPDTGIMTQDGNNANTVMTSVASIVASVILFVIAVRISTYKKIDFSKATK